MPTVRPFRFFRSKIVQFSLAFAAVLLALAWIGRGQAPGSPVRVALAITEAAMFGWFVIALVRSIRALDELERRIHLEAFAGAAIVTVIVIVGWGFLEQAGLPRADATLVVVPVVTGTWVLRVLQISRRYR